MATQKIDTTWMTEGKQCWVDMEQEYLANLSKTTKEKSSEVIYKKGIIQKLEQEKQKAIIFFEKDQTTTEENLKDLRECNTDSEKCYEDMVDMEILNEPEILQNIKKYYQNDQIFTKIGPTLIVMNPYKYIPELFSDEIFESIRQESQQKNYDFSNAQPHVWSIAANSYTSLFEQQKNQAIVISGESGAGKTENTKYAMKFLTSLSENKNLFIINENVDEEPSIEEKILRCNPILEAFGNAKTVRNDNSSRFGKYVRIWIHGQSRKIQGASINKYLLEKTRVTHVAQGERNYHIFYHFIKGNQELEKYKLVNDSSVYKFLDSDCVNVAGIKDLDLYEQVISSFKKLGFSNEEQNAIFRIIAGILHIGNLEIDDQNYSDQNPCDIANKDILEIAADQLQVSPEDLKKAITLKIRAIGKQVIESPIDKNNCEIMKDTIAKALYDKVFDWLVVKLNQGIEPEQQSDENLSLGLLDIFGFENFEINSFEQLCINFTNEKLQQLYIEYVFKSEKKEFVNEGLEDKLTTLEYKDNQDVIDLISLKRLGIFELLDESCSLANNTDSGLLTKIQNTHDKNPCLKKEKIKSQKQFTVIHTAKDVTYDIDGFRLKNKDEIVQSIASTLEASKNENILKIWKHADEEESQQNDGPTKRKGKSDKYLGAKFRMQMDGLMSELQSCGVHFIRCLKPNEQKQRGLFHQPYVMQQIKYLGVLESVKVRKEGFPFRLQYEQFYEKYHEIHSKKYLGKPLKLYINNKDQLKEICQEIIQFIFQNYKQNTNDTILFGQTKIYMRFENSQYIGESLKTWLKKKEGLLTKIQQQARQYIFRKTTLQNLKTVLILKKRFIKIQACYKRNKQRKKYLQQINYTKAVDQLQITQQKFLKKAFQKYQDQVQCLKLGQQQREQYLKEQEEKRKQKEQEEKQQQLQKQKQENEQKQKQQQEEEQQKQKQQQLEQQKQQQQKQESQQPQQQNQESLKTQQQQQQQQYSQNINYQQQDIFEDDFTKEDNLLPIWLNNMPKRNIDSDFRDKSESKLSQYMTQSTINSKQSLEKLPTYVQTSEAYKSLEDTLEPKDFEPNFIKKVESNDFLVFCQNFIVRGSNFSKNVKIEKAMSFSKDSLKEPLTKCPDFAKEADLTWRSILKIGGNRRSRFPLTFHQSNAISICLGQDTLDGQEESNIYISQIDRKAQQQSNYGQHLAQKYNSNVLVPSDRGNFNGYQVILKLMNQIMGEKTLPIRNEVYFQICKQLEGNSSEGIKKLYKFCSLCLNIFAPGSNVMLPLLNFFYNKAQKEKHQENKKQANYIFNKLALIYQSYLLIREMPFIITEELLHSCKILKQDPIQSYLNPQTFKKVIPFELMEYHISNLTNRCILPIKDEIQLINERQSMVVNIHLFSQVQDQIKINCTSSKTVFQIRNEIMSKLDMTDISHCYGLYEVKSVQDKIIQEQFLPEGDKIMDILSSQKNEEYYYFQKLNKLLVCKIYLKVKFQYPFTKQDHETVQMQYSQAIFDYQNKQIYNFSTIESVNIAAHILYVKFGNSAKEAQQFLQNNMKLLIPDLYNRNVMNTSQWQQRIISQYSQFNFETPLDAQFSLLNIFRKFDEFLAHNFEGRIFEIEQQGEGYVKSNQPKPCIISFKPLYIIIQKTQKQIDNKHNNIVQIANNANQKTVIPVNEIQSWGKSIGKANSYFYIKNKKQQLFIFAVKDLNSPDYILNMYKNYIYDKETQKKSACKYFDILSFLMNQIPDQQEQVEEDNEE